MTGRQALINSSCNVELATIQISVKFAKVILLHEIRHVEAMKTGVSIVEILFGDSPCLEKIDTPVSNGRTP